MQLHEEGAVVVAKGCSTTMVDGQLEILLGNGVECLPVAAAAIGSTIGLATLGLEGQGIALAVNTCHVATAGLVSAGLKRHTANQSVDISLRQVVLVLGTDGVHQWLNQNELVDQDIVDRVAA